MRQTRLGSLLEALVNTVVGYFISVGVQLIVFPWYGINLPLSTNMEIVGIFMVVSLTRSYILRRFFNAQLRNATQAIANLID